MFPFTVRTNLRGLWRVPDMKETPQAGLVEVGDADITNIWVGNAASPDDPRVNDKFNMWAWNKIFFNVIPKKEGTIIVGVYVDGRETYLGTTDVLFDHGTSADYYNKNGKPYWFSAPYGVRFTKGKHTVRFRIGKKDYPTDFLRRAFGIIPITWLKETKVFEFETVVAVPLD